MFYMEYYCNNIDI